MDIYKSLRIEIEKYFNDKLDDADVSEELERELWDKVEDLIDKVQDSVSDTTREIDREIEDFNWHDYRVNQIDDFRTQEYLERVI